jgi:hypothetical protein
MLEMQISLVNLMEVTVSRFLSGVKVIQLDGALWLSHGKCGGVMVSGWYRYGHWSVSSTTVTCPSTFGSSSIIWQQFAGMFQCLSLKSFF